MNSSKIYDIIGIGIGPFNLGLAALATDIAPLECIFIDKQETFNWHPGLLLPAAKMQVPFYADLVTLANPCSRFTYLAWLKATGRLFKFAINEAYFPYRSEFNTYCKWVTGQLPSLHFGYNCESIIYDAATQIYGVVVKHTKTCVVQQLHGKHIVLGTGTTPALPNDIQEGKSPLITHAANYVHKKEDIVKQANITIIGSGQSAAEIFYDLMPYMNQLQSLHWFTRSARFFPMDYSKLTLEMSSPDYIDHFYTLSPEKKNSLLKDQQYLYRGINAELIHAIYEQLYLMELAETKPFPQLFTNCALKHISMVNKSEIILHLEHFETGKLIEHRTNAVILATGYKYDIPACIASLDEHILRTNSGQYKVQRNYSIDQNNTVFVQNADLHTHGFNSADLGLGPYRNAVILNTIMRNEHYKIERNNVFQTF